MTARALFGDLLRAARARAGLSGRPSGPGWHRRAVGGRWDELGRLQFEFMRGVGLEPGHRLLDVGCGALRGGVHFIAYLDPGHYVGIDKEPEVLVAGHDLELVPAGLQGRGARLHAAPEFELDWLPADERFDFALAQSVLTHLRPGLIRLCFARVGARLTADGVFFASFFESDGADRLGPVHAWRDDELAHPRYALTTLRDLAGEAGLSLDYVGAWGHPRDSRMIALRRA